jgi:CubicO group peptidase (beta-lactamase class C family)
LFRYSGGGYTIMQLMVEDVTGRPFAEVMADRVLGPVGMASSTYEQPLPEELAGRAAVGYRSNGEPVEGRWHRYPEQAAAGLWTTPTDLARWAIAVQKGYGERSHPVLDPETIDAMLTEGPLGHGLGPGIMDDGEWFGHGGANEGYRCSFRARIGGDEGVAIMTNSDAGSQLATELLFTIAREYDWADVGPRTLTPVPMTEEQLSEYVGGYAADDPYRVTVELVEGRLYVTPTWAQQTDEILPDGEDHFFVRDDATSMQFIREDGRLVALEVQGFRFARENP